MMFMQKDKSNKLFFLFYMALILMGVGAILFAFNNYEFYDESIAKVVETNEEYLNTETLNYGYKEDTYMQTIKAKVMNGEDKGEIVSISNEYHKGEAYDQRYYKGDELFISLNKQDGVIKKAHIEGYKRDKYIVLLVVSFVLVIVLVGRLKGFLSIISVVLNVILFYVIVGMNAKGVSLPVLSFVGAILFSIICLSLVSGLNKKTLAAIVSSVIGVSVTMLISLVVIHITKYSGVRFEQMELLTRPYDGIFIAEIILGGLGAIMDISISMATSLNELIEKDEKITVRALKKSGYNIGRDIMSTMINVLFFTYICSVIPNLTIYFRNGIELGHLVNEYISLEMTRALTGAIGITVTIPISIYISLLLYKRSVK